MHVVPTVHVERALIELASLLDDYNLRYHSHHTFEPEVAAMAIEAMISPRKAMNAKKISKRLKLRRRNVDQHIKGLSSAARHLREDYCIELCDGEGPALSRKQFADALRAVALMMEKHAALSSAD